MSPNPSPTDFVGIGVIQRLIVDIDTIKKLLMKSVSPEEQADQFRQDRVYDILAGVGPVVMQEGAKVFLHIVPLFEEPVELALNDKNIYNEARDIGYICTNGGFSRFNFDGFLVYDTSRRNEAKTRSYIQFFRNGCIELCNTSLLSPSLYGVTEVQPVPMPVFEEKIIEFVTRLLSFLDQINIPFPLIIFLSLTGVKDHKIYTGYTYYRENGYPINRDHLFFEGKVINQKDQPPEQFLKSIFDLLWNAGGYLESPYYDTNGERKQ